jgi:tetrahydromethanopterin S-methyltransferase subunit B
LFFSVGTHRNGHKKKGGLGTGAIVGIVVGVLILVLIIIGVIYWFKFKSKESK